MDQSVVGSNPDRRSAERRWRDGVDDAALAIAISRIRGCLVKGRRNYDFGAGEIRTDLRPGLRSVAASEHELVGIIEIALVRFRENQWLRPVTARGLRRWRPSG